MVFAPPLWTVPRQATLYGSAFREHQQNLRLPNLNPPLPEHSSVPIAATARNRLYSGFSSRPEETSEREILLLCRGLSPDRPLAEVSAFSLLLRNSLYGSRFSPNSNAYIAEHLNTYTPKHLSTESTRTQNLAPNPFCSILRATCLYSTG